MIARVRRLLVVLPVVALAACGKPDTAPGPGGITEDEAKALDQAAEMIDSSRLPGSALRPPPPSPVGTATPSPAAPAAK